MANFIQNSINIMKNLLLLAMALLLGGPALAQEGFHIGFMGGPQYSRIFNMDDPLPGRTAFQYERTWGWNAMAKIGYNIGDPLGFHLGLIYSKQGQIHTATDTARGIRVTSERELTYLKIPLYLHINSDPGPVMFALELGPQLGLLQDAAYFDDGSAAALGTTADQLFKPRDIAFAWSLGLEIAATEWLHFVVAHRGDYSVVDFENKDLQVGGVDFYENGRGPANNATFSIQAGLVFCISPNGSGKTTKFWFR